MQEQVYRVDVPQRVELLGSLENNVRQISLNMERRGVDIPWLQNEVATGNLPEEVFMNLVDMMGVLEGTYPGLWDIQITPITHDITTKYVNRMGYPYIQDSSISTYNFSIIIKFPEIIIKNKYNESRLIKDLYIKLVYRSKLVFEPFSEPTDDEEYDDDENVINFGVNYRVDYKFDNCVSGMRGILSDLEFKFGYLHSHLSGGGSTYSIGFTGFCLGEGELTQLLGRLRIDGYDTGLFQLYCYQVESYASYESLEGGPYIKMNTVIPANQSIPKWRLADLPVIDLNQYILQFKANYNAKFITGLPIPDIDWKIEDGKMRIIDNDKFDDLLLYSNDQGLYHSHHVYYKDGDGYYYKPDSVPTVSPTSNDLPIPRDTKRIFRGQEISLQLYREDFTEPNYNHIVPKLIINPSIRKYMIEKFEQYANYTKIKNQITGRANQIALTQSVSG